jgi:hypothetical protein
MAGPAIERVVLELNPGEPISGRIREQTGHAQSFRGWLELTTKLERLRSGRDNAADEPEGNAHPF